MTSIYRNVFSLLKGCAMAKYLLMGLLLSTPVPQAAIAATGASDPSLSTGKFSVAGLIGYGIGFDSSNEYAFGFGVRLGYTFPFRLYTGASFINYLGGSAGRVFGVDIILQIWTAAAEVGYELVAGPIEIRPFLGLGVGNISGYRVGEVRGDAPLYFALMPGAVVTFGFNGPLSTGPFVGADIHMTWLPAASGANDISLLATGGYRF
jgi:hypothetical protein